MVAILQARMSSTRLPGKVMSLINGKPMIGWQIGRIQRSKEMSHIIVATSDHPSDDLLATYVESIGVEVFRGPMADVYSRFVGALSTTRADAFLRLTADCPLVMPDLIDEMVRCFNEIEVDYLSNTMTPTFPDGLDVEIVSMSAFNQLAAIDLTSFEREHVTPGIQDRPNNFVLANFANDQDLSAERWTVDYPADFEFVSRVFAEFKGRETTFGLRDLVEFLRQNPEIRNLIPGTMRNITTINVEERFTDDAK